MNELMVHNQVSVITASTISSYLVQNIQFLFISVLKSYPITISIKYRSYNREFTNGMVITPIFAFFLNNVFNSAHFF